MKDSEQKSQHIVLTLSFQNTMGSSMSIYSETGDYDLVDVSGEIVYSVGYDEHTQSLVVHIKECRDLAYADTARRHCNPYVRHREGGLFMVPYLYCTTYGTGTETCFTRDSELGDVTKTFYPAIGPLICITIQLVFW